MGIIIKDNQKEYTPAPEGLHQAVCVDVVDQGMQETPWGLKHKIQIRWQISERNSDTEKRFMVVKGYTASLHKKSNLRQQLESWRGRKFTQKELEGFDVEKLVSINCQLQIAHSIADDSRVFANLQAIVPLGKDMVKLEPEEYERVKDRSEAPAQNTESETEEPEDDLPF